MRGKRCSTHRRTTYPRITPARAGKTLDRFPSESRSADHPRACGENRTGKKNGSSRRGSPPRVRGKHRHHAVWDGPDGITPARAGKTILCILLRIAPRDHPRACGENLEWFPLADLEMGSPPRVRGKRHGRSGVGDEVGITPARAGKTARGAGRGARAPDHPRACGENGQPNSAQRSMGGSPPRVRGKQVAQRRVCHVPGITPARAGKTCCWWRPSSPPADHPRACGENQEPLDLVFRQSGSPPRVRGKRPAAARYIEYFRITPARAGKTRFRPAFRLERRDHPRACGENPSINASNSHSQGSPPRVRGKQLHRDGGAERRGITPARAGKTSGVGRRSTFAPDHPRACGENRKRAEFSLPRIGSPPRVRGKQSEEDKLVAHLRITPARAGKTSWSAAPGLS